MCVCVCVREPVLCFCFENGITNVYVSTVLSVEIKISLVISKEAVGNSWDILNAILGHKYHSNQTASYLMNETKICNKS